MAKEKRTIEVIANCYIRYDLDNYKTGDKFKIRKSDLENLSKKGYVQPSGNIEKDEEDGVAE